jgi:DNA-binding LacI/PurR family transcriptional regulator
MGQRSGQMLLARLAGEDPGATRVNIGFAVVGRTGT